jgi:uncharacterized membrane protein YozB (DUF420 family)
VNSARTWLLSSIGFGFAGVVLFAVAFSIGISSGGSSGFLSNIVGLLLVVCAVLWGVSLLIGMVLLIRQPRKGALEIAIVVLSFALLAYLFGPNVLSRLGLG